MADDRVEYINPPDLVDYTDHFTQVVAVPAGHRLVFVSGQIGAKADGVLVSDDFEGQIEQSFINLRAALAAVGARPDQVVKIDVLIVDHSEAKLPVLGAQVDAMWGNRKPASTLIPVPRLAEDDMLFEIDAIAAVPVE
jgi:enamine deaminase RidA (YjgF/YER057c/UK114 family)